MIQGWYCREKFDPSHSQGVKGQPEYLNMLLKGDDLVSIEEEYFKVNDKILKLVYLPDTVYNSANLHLDLKLWSLGPMQIKITVSPLTPKSNL